jgi:predicted TIM-barrel fold metal-dependent hydrolase
MLTLIYEGRLIMIVDIHVHPSGGGSGIEKMLESGRRAGINKQVFMGIEKEMIDKFPDQIIGFVRGRCTDPESPAILEEYVKNYGYKGVKIHQEPNWPLTALLSCHPIFRKAEELRVPVLIHSWHEEEGLSEMLPKFHDAYFPVSIMAELGKRYTDTTFIFAHAGGIWVKAFQAAKPYTNLCFDMSGFDPERGIVEAAVDVLGPERVFFGSDAPGRNYAAQLAKVQYADISERDKKLIMGENAIRLLDLR